MTTGDLISQLVFEKPETVDINRSLKFGLIGLGLVRAIYAI
jgi:hypothetical protein